MKKKLSKTYDKLKNRLRLIFCFGKKKKKVDLKGNFVHFLREEEKEIEEFLTGKEDFPRYCKDSAKVFKDYFIPGDHNEHHPKILRPKPIIAIAVLMVAMKLFLAVYIFAIYQEEAEMSAEIVNRILVLTNEARLENDAPALSINNVLSRAAMEKAEDMLIKDYFAHTTPDGKKPWDFVDRGSYPYALIGENLAMNFIAADDAHSALMASPSHQKNILNPRYGEIGLAVISGEMSGKSTKVLVQLFGAQTLAAASVNETPPPPPAIKTPPQEEPKTEPLPEPLVAGDSSEPEKTGLAQTEKTETTAKPVPEEIIQAPEPERIEETPEEKAVENELQGEIDLLEIENVSEEETRDVASTDFEEEIGLENPGDDYPYMKEDGLTDSDYLDSEPIHVVLEGNSKISRASKTMLVAKIVYVVFLVFLIVSLLINIFIRVTIQHKPAITRTLLLIFLILILLIFDFGFMREIKQAAENLIVL